MRPDLSFEQVSISEYQDELSGIAELIAQDNDFVYTLLRERGKKQGGGFEPFEIKGCYNDAVIIINVLEDYARMLEEIIAAQELGTTDPFKGARWEYHAKKCKEIAAKWSKQLGYSFEEACEACAKKRSKPASGREVGQDGLTAWYRQPKENGEKPADEEGGTDTGEQRSFT